MFVNKKSDSRYQNRTQSYSPEPPSCTETPNPSMSEMPEGSGKGGAPRESEGGVTVTPIDGWDWGE